MLSLIHIFLIQNKEREKNFSQSFTKIRKKHTTFLQKGEPKNQYHTGIFVDIFPIDRMPNGFLKRKIFQIECILYQIYTREFAPIYGKKWEKISTNFLLFIIPKKCRPTVRKKLLNRIKKWNCDKSLHTIAIETVSTKMCIRDSRYICFLWYLYSGACTCITAYGALQVTASF